MNATTAIDLKPTNKFMKPIETLILEHPFLKDLSLQHLVILMECAKLADFTEDQLIISEGDSANRFFLILDGEVVLESHVRNSGVVQIQTVGAGDVLGWSWLFPPYHWHFDARALKATKAIFFYGTHLRERCEQDHDLGYQLMKRTAEVVIKRLQSTRRKLLEEVGILPAEARALTNC